MRNEEIQNLFTNFKILLKYITTFLLFFFYFWINQLFNYFHFYISFGILYIIKLGIGMSKFFLIKFLFVHYNYIFSELIEPNSHSFIILSYQKNHYYLISRIFMLIEFLLSFLLFLLFI